MVGGDWNHGILNDELQKQMGISECHVIPTDERSPSFFRGVAKNHQPV